MAINKVEFGDEVLIDLTEDTVTEDTLLEGETAHDASGNPIRGRAKIDTTEVSTTDLSNSAKGNIRSLHLFGRGRKSKNLLNPTYETKTSDGVTCTNNGDGTYTLNGTSTKTTFFDLITTANFPMLENGKKYKLIGCPAGGSENSYMLKVRNAGGKYDIGNGYEFTYDESVTDYKVVIRIEVNTVCDNLIFKPMITEDLTATYDYFEPYGLITSDGIVKSANADNTQTSSINASEILNSTFTGVNDVKDELIVNADGSGKFIKRVHTYIINGTEKMGKGAATTNHFCWIKIPSGVPNSKYHFKVGYDAHKVYPIISDNFDTNSYLYTQANSIKAICYGWDPNELCSVGFGLDSGIDTEEKFKEWFANNPTTVIYELATPIETNLTPSQVSALLSLKTFTDNTTITSDCDYEIGYFLKNWQSIADVDVKVNNVASVVADNGDWLRGKNLLNPTLETTTKNGVTCTNNGDGTYTLNGTATGNVWFNLLPTINENKAFLSQYKGKTLRFIGCPSGGAEGKYSFALQGANKDGIGIIEYGDGKNVIISDNINTFKTVWIKIYVFSGQTLNNLVFKPMIVDADLYPDVTYDDFEPYTKSNVELTSELRNLIKSDTVSDTTDATSNIPTSGVIKNRLVISAVLVGGDIPKHDGIVTVGGYNGVPWYFHITGSSGNPVGSGKNVTVKYWYIDMP